MALCPQPEAAGQALGVTVGVLPGDQSEGGGQGEVTEEGDGLRKARPTEGWERQETFSRGERLRLHTPDCTMMNLCYATKFMARLGAAAGSFTDAPRGGGLACS